MIVRFKVDITGECWAQVPDDLNVREIQEHLEQYSAMFAGNKVWGGPHVYDIKDELEKPLANPDRTRDEEDRRIYPRKEGGE